MELQEATNDQLIKVAEDALKQYRDTPSRDNQASMEWILSEAYNRWPELKERAEKREASKKRERSRPISPTPISEKQGPYKRKRGRRSMGGMGAHEWAYDAVQRSKGIPSYDLIEAKAHAYGVSPERLRQMCAVAFYSSKRPTIVKFNPPPMVATRGRRK